VSLVLKAGVRLSAPIAQIVHTASANVPPATMNLFLLVLQIAVVLLASLGPSLLTIGDFDQ